MLIDKMENNNLKRLLEKLFINTFFTIQLKKRFIGTFMTFEKFCLDLCISYILKTERI